MQDVRIKTVHNNLKKLNFFKKSIYLKEYCESISVSWYRVSLWVNIKGFLIVIDLMQRAEKFNKL